MSVLANSIIESIGISLATIAEGRSEPEGIGFMAGLIIIGSPVTALALLAASPAIEFVLQKLLIYTGIKKNIAMMMIEIVFLISCLNVSQNPPFSEYPPI